MSVNLKDQIACVRRELAMRERVYPKRVLSKQMTPEAERKEMAAMRAVLATLESMENASGQHQPF